jgi:predicted regulator of Ras-like GTPase activity (Roadblock/LC7/MglB family)
MNDLVLYNEDILALNGILSDFIRTSKVDCALVSSSEGHLLTYQGLTAQLDTTALAALVTGSFSASRSVARLFGEEEFQTVFHKGKNITFHISLLNKDFYLTSIFGSQVIVEEIEEHVTVCVHKLVEFLSGIKRSEEFTILPDLETKLIYFERKNSDSSTKTSAREADAITGRAIAAETIGEPAAAEP